MEDTVKTADPDTPPRKFLFDHSFDVERKSERKRKAEEEKPPEPTFSKEELEAARQDGYAKGMTAGAQEAASRLEAATRELLENIGGQLPALSADQAQANDRLQRDGAKVAATIARKILPGYAAQHGTDELTALVTQCLRTLVSQPKIVVRVSPSQVGPITEHLESATAASGFDGRFLIEADDSMGPSDCRLAWQGGGLERSEADIWKQVDAAIEDYLGPEPAAEDAAAPAPGNAAEATESAGTPETVTGVENHASSDPGDDGTAAPHASAEAPEAPIETTADTHTETPTEIPADMPDPLEDR